MAIAAPIAKELVEDILMLTPMQESMLFHYLSSEQSLLYCEQIGIEIEGDINIDAFISAWRAVTAANEPLRAVIRWNEQHKAVQIIKRRHEIPIIETDLTYVAPEQLAEKMQELRESRLADRIDVREAPFRMMLCKLSEAKFELLIDFHHMILDGWSLGVLLQEFVTSYGAMVRGTTIQLQRKTSYSSYIQWLKEQDRPAQEAYWRKYLSGLRQRTLIPGDRPQLGAVIDPAVVRCVFEDTLVDRAKQYSLGKGISIASLLYGAWGVLLQKYNNSNDVCFGVTVSGRPPEIPGIEHMTGLFIQTVPLRMTSSPGQAALDFVLRTAADLSGKEANAALPVREFSSFTDTGEGVLPFDTVMVIKNYPLDQGLSFDAEGLRFKKSYGNEETNFDLTLQVTVHDGIAIDFHYNTEIYDRSTIEQLAARYRLTVAALIELGNRPLAELQLVTPTEREELGRLFHATAAEITNDRIEDLIWEQAVKLPDQTAVRFEEQSLTYAGLKQEAVRIAELLKRNGIEPTARVALSVPRSAMMVAAFLGILEADCICVPLDPSHPAERTQAIVEDCGAAAMIVEDATAAAGFEGLIVTIPKEKLSSAGSAAKSASDAGERRKADSSTVACMIYTSGSTGKPKGAMLHHRGIVNHAFAKINDLGIDSNDKVGNSFSINVVASIWQILAPLFAGAELIVYSAEVERDPLEQFKLIEADGVSVIEVIPSVLNAYVRLLESGHPSIPLNSLKVIALTSEETKPGLVNRFYNRYNIQLVNAYGQTECCDDTLHYRIPMSTWTERVPIGRPVLNTRPYIVDFNGALQPMGMVGELIVAGAGVSSGYWNRPELNEEKFIEHPLEPGTVMYRTGDLATWLPDGTIRYLGRVDHQVKIRGNRIELSEIENGIARMNAIREVAVILRSNQREEEALWAFFTADRPLTVKEIRLFLQDLLPSYMMPEQLVQLEAMPLMPNGKINRGALRSIEADSLPIGNAEAAPASEIERQISAIWQDVLRKDRLNISDTFFDAGGNSLLILQLTAQLNARFGVQLTVAELFTHATIRKQAERIRMLTAKELASSIAVRSVRLPESAELSASTAHGDTLTFEVQVPSEVWKSLMKVDKAKAIQASEAAFAALGLLLNKISGQNEVNVYAYRPEDGRIKPIHYNFEFIDGIPELAATLATDKEQWLESGAFLLPTNETGTEAIRPVMSVRSDDRKVSPELSNLFNLHVEWHEQGNDSAVLSWRLEHSAFPRDLVKQWVGAHSKLTAFIAEQLASQSL
ncbi:amino acid adenylation domain-containing protein [Paenibacillus cellulosilyticus]|uniref:Amino acid adenylation domain-containing protein n=1 Tax=Paenibacillus cellulosilyticus TaxID=375489 RepID=A0A2V2YUZ5_9BACL|nr:non-ribosomal peptide synthetase [Paenibacillus cellulosilyticus]PWW04856.1 amino acid adenylation domain-containing protein [Paenibacillus cellulosilyticus]QKS45968.1 amino acid adenylation domain-containing protein [Paenibacillus cellulosilyticus]